MNLIKEVVNRAAEWALTLGSTVTKLDLAASHIMAGALMVDKIGKELAVIELTNALAIICDDEEFVQECLEESFRVKRSHGVTRTVH